MVESHGTATPDLKAPPYPLAGLRVLDLTVALAGPLCTRLLAGLGAEVIKIEPPGGGDIARTNPPFAGKDGLNFGAAGPDDISLTILNRSRGKKSVTLDLKLDGARAIFMGLARQSDVVVQNLSDGAVDRLGVGFDAVNQHNPRIIYASISGLGEPSPYPAMKAMDIIVQALSGIMEVTGAPDGPPMRVGVPVGDMTAPLFATIGILSALRHRDRTGLGQHVEVNLLACLTSLVAEEHFDLFHANGFPQRSGNYHDRLTPFGVYAAKDGHVAVAAPTDVWTRAIFDAMGRPELIQDERFRSRGLRTRNATALNALIESWTEHLSAETVVEELYGKRKVPAVRVRTPREAITDQLLRGRGGVSRLHHQWLDGTTAAGAGLPISFSACRADYDRAVAELGADNREVYNDLLNLDQQTVVELKGRRVI